MKLRPLEGIDDLRFGDSPIKAAAQYGDADQKRCHPDERCRTTLEYRKKGLSLGFDASDRLVFIAALSGKEEVELWGERPFDFVRSGSDVQRWSTRLKFRAQAEHDSFGARVEVAEARVTFCFSSEEPHQLEGIQLSAG